mgnify:CR=1 FL=1
MNELTKGLTNLRSLRAAIRDLTLEQAESSLLKLQAAVEEKRAQAAEIEQAEQERRARIAKYKELIKQEGITAEELTAIIGAAPSSIRKKREPRPAIGNTMFSIFPPTLFRIRSSYTTIDFKIKQINSN